MDDLQVIDQKIARINYWFDVVVQAQECACIAQESGDQDKMQEAMEIITRLCDARRKDADNHYLTDLKELGMV